MSDAELDEILGVEYTSLPQDKQKAFLIFHNRVLNKYGIRDKPSTEDKRLYIQDIQSFLIEYDINADKDVLNDPESINSHPNNFARFDVLVTALSNSFKARIAKERSVGVLDVIKIRAEKKDDIRKAVNSIKSIIDGIDFDIKKKESLFNKLNLFLRELDNELTRLNSILTTVVEISSATGDVAEEMERTIPFIKKLLKLLGLSADETGILPPWQGNKQLEPPLKQIEHHIEGDSKEEDV